MVSDGPYAELGLEGLAAEREVTTAETFVAEATVEVEGEIAELVARVMEISPRTAGEAEALGAQRLATDERLIEAHGLHGEALRRRDRINALIEREGVAWLIPTLKLREASERAAIAAAAEKADAEAAALAAIELESLPKELPTPEWEPAFRDEISTALDMLAEAGLLQVVGAEGDQTFAERALSVVRLSTQSRSMGTKTAIMRLAEVSIVPNLMLHQNDPAISVRTMVAMALLNSNRDVLGRGAKAKQAHALKLIDEMAAARLQDMIRAARQQRKPDS